MALPDKLGQILRLLSPTQGNFQAGVNVLQHQNPVDPSVNPRGTMLAGKWKPAEPGNIDLLRRPQVQNPDGSVSTVRSVSFDDGPHTVVVPSVVNGRVVSDPEAYQFYRATGQHLGKFNDPQEAERYAEALHKQQEKFYPNKG